MPDHLRLRRNHSDQISFLRKSIKRRLEGKQGEDGAATSRGSCFHYVDFTGEYPLELNRFAFENSPADWPLQRFLADLLAVYGHSILPTVENKGLLIGEALFETLKMVYKN
jgi:hypothetical protein